MRRTLHDADGTPIASYDDITRDGRRVADYVELEVEVERAVPVILEQLRGFRVAGGEELGRALIAAGGRPGRHAHIYAHDLQDDRPLPDPPPGLEFAPADRAGADLLDAYHAAHQPGHPDLVEGEDVAAHLDSIRPLDCSGLAVDRDGRVVAAILVADTEEGPWVSELFRDPAHRGAGRALLARALALADGLPSLKLVVTVGNPAERLYQELGFRRTYTAFSVDL